MMKTPLREIQKVSTSPKFDAEMNNEENPALNEQMRKELEKLSEGSANIGSELRNPHPTSAVQEVSPSNKAR